MAAKMLSPQPRRILRLPAVLALTGVGRTYIYEQMKLGNFPQSRPIGVRAVGWDSLEIEAWVNERLNGE